MIGLVIVAAMSGTTADAPPVYGPEIRPRIERVEGEDSRRFLAEQPEQAWLDESGDGVQVKWRGRKVKLRVPLG